MPTYRQCKIHGLYEGKTCPDCKKPKDKKSPKYGGTTIVIPPNMRAS